MSKVYIAHATGDERGKLSGGQPGDQTKNEVKIQEWYSRPWTRMLRCKSPYNRALIAKAMIEAARNDNIGYCQGHRRTLYESSQHLNFQLSLVREPCECDCSSLVAVAVLSAGYKISPDVYTGNLEAALLATGDFESFKGQLYVGMTSALIPGDILLYPGHHTAVVVSCSDPSKLGNGWYYDVEGWHYRRDGIAILDGWADINGHRYLFVGGVMKSGMTLYGGKLYYLEPSAADPYEGALYVTDERGALELGRF